MHQVSKLWGLSLTCFLVLQPEPESRLPGKQPFKGGGRGRTALGRGRGTHGKAGARSYGRNQEGVSSGFLIHGLPSQQLDLGKVRRPSRLVFSIDL